MKKIILKAVTALTMATVIAGAGTAVCAREMWLHVNNQGVQRNVCQVWGFDMLPVLDIAGELGFNVSFDGSAAVLYNGGKSYAFTLGDASVYDNDGNWYGLDVVPQFINGRFMVPAKFFTDVLGYSYVWDPVMDYLFLNSEYKYDMMINSYEYSLAQKYHTNEFKQKARVDLRIPDYMDVDCIYGAPYYWEGAALYVTPISFYHNGELIARADFNTQTHEIARSIYMYLGE